MERINTDFQVERERENPHPFGGVLWVVCNIGKEERLKNKPYDPTKFLGGPVTPHDKVLQDAYRRGHNL